MINMKIGVVYPQTEFGNDPTAIRDYVQTAEGLDYDHILAYDHILGANPERPEEWQGPYTFKNPFHEPFVLFSYMAAVTSRINFTTGIIILPQRQTALVAKQAATLDVLSNGRLRLGFGIGWNWVEYIALNKEFHNRGKRIEEQVNLLRQLWTEPLVTYKGQWHEIPDAGLNPLPVQRPIPIWFGGHADVVLERVAYLGDGWMPNYRTADAAIPSIERIMLFLYEAGRHQSESGIEARLKYDSGDPSTWTKTIREWQAVGATHISINTMGCGYHTPQEHILAIRVFASEVIG